MSRKKMLGGFLVPALAVAGLLFVNVQASNASAFHETISRSEANAGVPVTVTVDISSNPGCGTQAEWANKYEIYVGINGSWTTTMMTLTSFGSVCGNYLNATYKYDVPAQPAGTVVEYVIKKVGIDIWLKAGSNLRYNSYQNGYSSLGNYQNFSYTTVAVVETPYVVIDYPTENESIGPTYTIRIGSNAAANNVRVKIDTGDWSQAYYSSGYWWFDWANYGMGSHTIVAEGWNVLGQRSETSIRNVTRTN